MWGPGRASASQRVCVCIRTVGDVVQADMRLANVLQTPTSQEGNLALRKMQVSLPSLMVKLPINSALARCGGGRGLLVTVCVGRLPRLKQPAFSCSSAMRKRWLCPSERPCLSLPLHGTRCTGSKSCSPGRALPAASARSSSSCLHLRTGAHAVLQGGRQTRRALGLVCSRDNHLHPPVPPLKLA